MYQLFQQDDNSIYDPYIVRKCFKRPIEEINSTMMGQLDAFVHTAEPPQLLP
jgi:hypothetical protein